jgi:hypothetical protein
LDRSTGVAIIATITGIISDIPVNQDQTRHHQKTDGESKGKTAKFGYCAVDDARV